MSTVELGPGLWQELGWRGFDEPGPQTESSIERGFRLRGPVDDEWVDRTVSIRITLAISPTRVRATAASGRPPQRLSALHWCSRYLRLIDPTPARLASCVQGGQHEATRTTDAPRYDLP